MKLALLVLLAACGDLPPYTSGMSVVIEKDLPQPSQKKLDLLFLVDDSPLMASYHDRLARNFPNFANVLSTIPGGVPDLHLAVTTTDLGDDGAFHAISTIDGAYLTARARLDGTIEANFAGALSDVITQLGDVGAAGSTITKPLASAMHALETHPDFLRDDAALAIIIITPHDDTSIGDVADFAAWFKAQKPDPAQVLVGVVAGVDVPTPVGAASCTFDNAPAFPAARLAAFGSQFPNRNTFATICQEDLSDGLSIFNDSGAGGDVVIGDPCLERVPLDIDPDQPGLQASCSVSDVQRMGSEITGEQLIPACDVAGGARPCWSLQNDPRNCAGAGPAIVVTRSDFPPPNDHVIVQCLAE